MPPAAFTGAIEDVQHSWLHKSDGFDWNAKWDNFFGRYPENAQIPAQDVLEFFEKLKEKAGKELQKQFGG